MGINIDDNGTPPADVGGDKDRDNPDTYEDGDDNAQNPIIQE